MIKVEFNLKQLVRQLEAKNGRDYEIQQIAKACNLSRFTVAGIANNSNVRIELGTLAKLLKFFAAEGMPVAIGDLFTVTAPLGDVTGSE
jgi:hypothetical protein